MTCRTECGKARFPRLTRESRGNGLTPDFLEVFFELRLTKSPTVAILGDHFFETSSMTPRDLSRLLLGGVLLSAVTLFTSCSVDQDAAFVVGASQTGTAEKKESDSDSAMSKWQEAQEKRKAEAEKRREEQAKLRAEEEAAKKKELAEKERQEKIEQAKADAEKQKELAAKEKAAAEKKKQEELAQAEKEAAKKKADELAEKRKEERKKQRELAAANRDRDAADSDRSGGGFFGGGGGLGSAGKYKSQGHHIKVNHRLLGSLDASNSEIEIDLSEQRARVYKTGGTTGRTLVIETQVATGRSGYTTPTGSYRISEKAVEKRSTLYGRWVNSSGATIRSDGESSYCPPGATQFIGASMPYWMRVNGGIGMHVGYVPNGPASHGCIRVPSSVQPLIFSKVGVGTRVTIIQ